MTDSKSYGSANDDHVPQANQSDPNFYRTAQPLNYLNYLNVLGYVFNYILVFGTGNWFAKDLPDMNTVTIKYQTLLAPAGWAFSIWGIIFLAEALFTVAQLLPSYRSHPLVQNGVGAWFFIANLAQGLWIPLFLSRHIYSSMVAMALTEIPLIIIIINQQYETLRLLKVQNKKETWSDFWLLRFPFDIHCGWITVATILNVNIVFVAADASVVIQVGVTILSLAALLIAMMVALFITNKRPRYTIAFVLAWASYATQSGMRSPHVSVINEYSLLVIDSVIYASNAIYQIILLLILVKFIWGFCFTVGNDQEEVRGDVNDLLLDEEVPLASATIN